MLKDRMQECMNARELGIPEIAKICGVTYSAAKRWTDGTVKKLKPAFANKLAPMFGVNPIWLRTGVGRKDAIALDDRLVSLPLSNAEMIGREIVYEDLSETGNLAVYRIKWFERLNLNPYKCKRFMVGDSSMSPYISKGDIVLVNSDDIHITDNNSVYAILLYNKLTVRRLKLDLNGNLVVMSDNKEYPNEHLTPGDIADAQFAIIGRVLLRAGVINLGQVKLEA